MLLGGLSAAIIFILSNLSEAKRGNLSLPFGKKSLAKLGVGGVLVAAQYFTFTVSMQIGSVTETTMIVRLSPLLQVFMSVLFLGEKVKDWRNILIAAILCLGGAFMMQNVNFESLRQAKIVFMFFGFLCAFVMAGKAVLYGSLSKYDNLPKLFIISVGMIIGALLMSPFVKAEFIGVPSFNQMLILIFLGVLTSTVPSFIQLYAFGVIGSMGALSFFSYLLPLLGSVAAYLINHERGFDYYKLGFSFIVISIGIYLANRSIKKREEDFILVGKS